VTNADLAVSPERPRSWSDARRGERDRRGGGGPRGRGRQTAGAPLRVDGGTTWSRREFQSGSPTRTSACDSCGRASWPRPRMARSPPRRARTLDQVASELDIDAPGSARSERVRRPLLRRAGDPGSSRRRPRRDRPDDRLTSTAAGPGSGRGAERLFRSTSSRCRSRGGAGGRRPPRARRRSDARAQLHREGRPPGTLRQVHDHPRPAGCPRRMSRTVAIAGWRTSGPIPTPKRT